VILLHDNAPSHTAKLVKETIEAFGWEILSHATYSSDLAPSDYTHLHRWDTHLLSSASLLTKRYEKIDDWFGSKEQQFFWRGIHKLSKVEKMYSYRWAIFRIKYFLSFSSCNKRVFSIKKFRFHIYIPDTILF